MRFVCLAVLAIAWVGAAAFVTALPLQQRLTTTLAVQQRAVAETDADADAVATEGVVGGVVAEAVAAVGDSADASTEAVADASAVASAAASASASVAVGASAHLAGGHEGFGAWTRMFCGDGHNGFTNRITCWTVTAQKGVYEWATGDLAAAEVVVYVGQSDAALGVQARCNQYNTNNWATVGSHQQANFQAALNTRACMWLRWKQVVTFAPAPSRTVVEEGRLLRTYRDSTNLVVGDRVFAWNGVSTVPNAFAQTARTHACADYQRVMDCPAARAAERTAANLEIGRLTRRVAVLERRLNMAMAQLMRR